MDKLNFYVADSTYVAYLKEAEQAKRGFSRVPNMDYGANRKQKFLCGIVLQVNNIDYYVPVTSFREQKPDNFLIKADNGKVVSSLRFNYMFPIPAEAVSVRNIKGEPDRAYRSLLSQELKYCIKNQDKIQQLAERTYKRVLLGKNKGLVANSCDFALLENRCSEWTQSKKREESLVSTTEMVIKSKEPTKSSIADRIAQKKAFIAQRESQKQPPSKHKSNEHGL